MSSKKISKSILALALSSSAILAASHAFAAAQTWTGTGDGTTWDTSVANWTPGPTFTNTTDSVTFDATGIANNNINLPTSVTVTAFNVAQTTPAVYTINIAAGQSITSTGAVTIGQTGTTGVTSKVALVGTTGSFIETAGDFTASGNNSLASAPIGDFDASGLNILTYNNTSGNFFVGKGARTLGKVELPSAGINPTATISANLLEVGNSVPLVGSTGNNGGTSVLTLGSGTNILNANTINIGAGKASGKITVGTPGGSVTITGTAGGASTANITIGRQSSATGGGGVSSFLLAGDNATVQAGTVIAGNLGGATGGQATGNITFDTGTFNANSLQLALDTSGIDSAGAIGSFTLGTSSTSTGVLNVATTFLIGNVTSAVAAHTDTASFIINGGTANLTTNLASLNSSAVITLNTTFSLLGGTLNMNGNSIGSNVPANNKHITTVNMPITGKTATLQNLGGSGINDAGLAVNGGGTLILSGTNPYSNSTAVTNSSTLLVDGSYTGSGSFAVAAGSTLGGSGNAAALVNIAQLANLSPGDNNINTLAVGSATLAGTLNIDLDDTNANIVDLLNDAGTLDLTPATSAVNFNIAGTPSAAAYIFAKYGSLGGTFNSSNLPSGYTIDYNYLGKNDIALVASGGTTTPEPTSLALLALAAPLILKRRK